jgi:hypothetical protein
MYGLIKFVLKGRRGYMSKVRTVSRFALFFLVMAIATTAVAAEKATPSGKVSLESTSIAAGIGVSWGDGHLTFKGKDYPFSVEGLSLVDWGISKANATGDVYNLTDASKFAGTYVAAEAGLTLAGGMGGDGLAEFERRGHSPAFRFSGRPTAIRHQRTNHQDEVITMMSVEGREPRTKRVSSKR